MFYGEVLMDEKQLISQEIASAIAKFPNPSVLVNQGDGVQIKENYGDININIDEQALAKVLSSMFGVSPTDKPITHTVEWASLSRDYYCLFVLENEEYKGGVFSIAKDRALQKYTPREVREKYRTLLQDSIAELKQMPCIFAKCNMYYKRTEAYHPFLAGRICNIIPQGEEIKIYFSGFQPFPQQTLNQNIKLLHMASASMRNELDEEHWAIKQCNLIDAFVSMGLEIK